MSVIIKITQRMKKITTLVALLGCTYLSSAAVLKQGDGFLQEKNLAQTGCALEDATIHLGGDPCTGDLNAGYLRAEESEVEAGQSVKQEIYEDHQCTSSHESAF